MRNNQIKNKKLKILFVLDHFWPHIGGVERVFRSLIDGILPQADKIIVLTLRDPDCLGYEKIGSKIKIIRVGKNPLAFMILAIFKTYALARQVDLVHTTTYFSALPAFIGARLARKPVVITVHELFGNLMKKILGKGKGSLYQLTEKFLISLPFDYYVAGSNYTYNILRVYLGLPDQKLGVIYNGIDYSLWNPRNYQTKALALKAELNLDKSFVYLYYGRPGVSKGLEYLIQAVPDIQAKIPNSYLFLILSHFPADRYQMILGLIKKLSLEKSVIIKDPLPLKELPAYIKMADCVIVPSLSEGFGFTAAESCALGVPVVVSRVASLPEVVSGKVIFTQPADKRSLVEGVSQAHGGKWSIIEKKDFSWQKTTSDYLDLYKKILSKS